MGRGGLKDTLCERVNCIPPQLWSLILQRKVPWDGRRNLGGLSGVIDYISVFSLTFKGLLHVDGCYEACHVLYTFC